MSYKLIHNLYKNAVTTLYGVVKALDAAVFIFYS